MKTIRFSEEQMVAILHEAVRTSVAGPAKKHKVSEPTIYARSKQFGQQIKCFTVVDEFTRECLAIDIAGSIRSKRVIEVPSRLVSVHGAPLFMRSDNGPKFSVTPSWSGSLTPALRPS